MRVSEILGYGASAADLKRETYETMDPEEQAFLKGIADDVRYTLIEKGEKAASDWLAAQRLDMEEMLALYHLLPSHIRAALKRGAHEAR